MRGKCAVRQGSTLEQIEHLAIVTADDIIQAMMDKRRMNYPGSNCGNKIGDVRVLQVSDMWKLSCTERGKLHGQYRVAVGGRTLGEEDGPGRGVKRKHPDTYEPDFWHGRTIKLYEELISS